VGERPFASLGQLHEAMCRRACGASSDEQLALIRAHPHLVGPPRARGPAHARVPGEQAAAGLDALSADEAAGVRAVQRRIPRAVRLPLRHLRPRKPARRRSSPPSPERLENTREQEIAAALAEIDKIARLRIHDALWE
jgi:2-oxo-4-hydroxy-4-carboxy-5-ureidoimidazoline decarboxylase